jgi:transcriptional regulator with XRE-family HTH domain
MKTPYSVARIKRDLRAKGWNYTDLFRATNLGSATISRFMRGKSQTPKTAKKIADALGKDLSEYVR